MIFSILTMYNQTLELYLYCRCGSGSLQGRIQDFKLGGGGHIKKLRRAEGSANIFGIFRVKNHDFTRPPLDAPLRYACNCSVNHERQYPHSSTLYRCVLNNICRFKTNYVYSINGGGAFPISRSIELFLSLFVIRGNGPNEYQMIYFN
jgi:hypothetical protein